MSSSLGNGASFGQTNFPKGEKTTQSIWLHQGEGTWCSAESPLLLRLVVVGSFLTQFTGDFLLWQISAGVIGCKSSTCTSADIDLLKIIMSFNKESRIWQLWGIVWLQQSERSPRCSRMACGVLLVSLHSRFGPRCTVMLSVGSHGDFSPALKRIARNGQIPFPSGNCQFEWLTTPGLSTFYSLSHRV